MANVTDQPRASGGMEFAQKKPGGIFAYASIFFLVLTLQFAPVVGLLGFLSVGGAAWSFIGIARDALVILLAMGVMLRSLLVTGRGRWLKSVKIAFLMLAILAALALVSTADFAAVLLNLRRLVLFPLLFFAVAVSNMTKDQIHRLLNLIFGTTVLVAAFGIVEYFAPNELWSDYLRVVDYFSSNPLDPFGFLPFEESGRFFTWDLLGLTGRAVRRAVSTYLEPTTLAAALVCGCCLAAAARARKEKRASFKLMLILMCGALTISKGFVLFLIAAALYTRFGLPSPRHIFGLTIAGCAFALWMQALGLTEGMFAHISGLATAVAHIAGEPLGEGLGAAGNYAAEGSDMEIGAESGLGNLLAQIGVVGFFYVFWLQSIAFDVIKAQRFRQDSAGIYFSSMLLGWYISFLFSASSLGIGGNALIFLALSLYLHKNYSPVVK